MWRNLCIKEFVSKKYTWPAQNIAEKYHYMYLIGWESFALSAFNCERRRGSNEEKNHWNFPDIKGNRLNEWKMSNQFCTFVENYKRGKMWRHLVTIFRTHPRYSCLDTQQHTLVKPENFSRTRHLYSLLWGVTVFLMRIFWSEWVRKYAPIYLGLHYTWNPIWIRPRF